MQNNNKKKICIVTYSLAKGGAEKSAAQLSIMLHDLGYDVHVVSVLNDIDYKYKGQLLNLGKFSKGKLFKRFRKFFALLRFLSRYRFDLIIDNRSRPSAIKEFIICKTVYRNQNLVYMVHSYLLDSYIAKPYLLAKHVYKQAEQLVAVSQSIEQQLKQVLKFTNTSVIKNAINLQLNSEKADAYAVDQSKYILFIGRIDDAVKNIKLLIDAYELSNLDALGVKLLIVGEGKDKQQLKAYVDRKQMSSCVNFKSYTTNPFPYYKNALFTVLTSRFEGFPLVLIESLSVNTPVISVNCLSGPKEIVKDKENGLLVENYNPQALSQAMQLMVSDTELYNNCKHNAATSVMHLSSTAIALRWQQLITKLTT